MSEPEPPVDRERSPLRRLLSWVDQWASRPLTAIIVIAADMAWVLLSFTLGFPGGGERIFQTLVAAITLVSPAHGLLAVAAVAPIAELLAMLMRVEQFRLSEIVVLSFLTAWILRPWEDGRGPRMPRAMAMAGWLLILFGVFLLIFPAFRANPEQLSFQELGYGMGVIFAGVVLQGVVICFAVKTAREDLLGEEGTQSSAEDRSAAS